MAMFQMTTTVAGLEENGNLNGSASYIQDKNATGSDFRITDTGMILLLSFLYGMISLLAVVGNSLVITIIWKNKHMQTLTNMFLFNLALADVTVGVLAIPFQFQAALLQVWVLPHFLCSISPFVKETSVTVSVFSLTTIAVDRYYSIVHPLKHRLLQKHISLLIIAGIWVSSIAVSINMGLCLTVDTSDGAPRCLLTPRCREGLFSASGLTSLSIYILFLSSIQYIIPLIIITMAYLAISFSIWGSRPPGAAMGRRDQIMNEGKKKLIQMLIAIVILFAISWLPLQVYQVTAAVYPEVNKYPNIHIIWFCSNWLALSNSCHNPIICFTLNTKFRICLRQLLSACIPCVAPPQRTANYTTVATTSHFTRSVLVSQAEPSPTLHDIDRPKPKSHLYAHRYRQKSLPPGKTAKKLIELKLRYHSDRGLIAKNDRCTNVHISASDEGIPGITHTHFTSKNGALLLPNKQLTQSVEVIQHNCELEHPLDDDIEVDIQNDVNDDHDMVMKDIEPIVNKRICSDDHND